LKNKFLHIEKKELLRFVAYLFIVFFSIKNLAAQVDTNTTPLDSNYTHIATISEKVTFITTDKLLNVYVITARGEFVKYTPDGKEIARYNNFSLGNPSLADATNPFQILLYFPEFMTVVTLDNTLNEAARYELFDLNVSEVDALCFANDGNVWLYDPTTFTLKKIDRNSKVLLESENFAFVFDELPQPNFLIERNNRLYMNDPQRGVFIFDVYAAYETLIPVMELENLQVIDEQLVYAKGSTLQTFHTQMLYTRSLALPREANEKDRINIERNRVFVVKENEVIFYKF